MGKGDLKTKRGKIVNRSYGVRRPRKKVKRDELRTELLKDSTKKKKTKA